MAYLNSFECHLVFSFSAHLTDKVGDAFKQYNTTIVVIPGGCTSVLQPLDVSVNKPVKSILLQSWEQYMLEKSEKDSAKIPPPPKQLLVKWIDNMLIYCEESLSSNWTAKFTWRT